MEWALIPWLDYTIWWKPLVNCWIRSPSHWGESLNVWLWDSNAIDLCIPDSVGCHWSCTVPVRLHLGYATAFCIISRCNNSGSMCLCERFSLANNTRRIQAVDQQDHSRIVDSVDHWHADWRMDRQRSCSCVDVFWLQIHVGPMVPTTHAFILWCHVPDYRKFLDNDRNHRCCRCWCWRRTGNSNGHDSRCCSFRGFLRWQDFTHVRFHQLDIIGARSEPIWAYQTYALFHRYCDGTLFGDFYCHGFHRLRRRNRQRCFNIYREYQATL